MFLATPLEKASTGIIRRSLFLKDHRFSSSSSTMSYKELRTSMNRPLILALPPEVTSAIFETCYPPLTPVSDPNVVLATDPTEPLQNDSFRRCLWSMADIAWKTPRLWTVLAVPSNSNSSWHPLIRKWLERSGKLPLSISVYRHHRLLGKDHLADAYALINILNEHSDRWQTLQLLGLPTKLLCLFRGREDSTSLLNTLTITRCFDEKCTFFMRNASPVNINLADFSFDLFGVSWDNLTCARVEISTVEDCLRLLKDSPKLQIFQLDLMTDNDENETTPEQESPIRKMVHGRLKELYFTAFDKVPLENFLGILTLPALQKLTIHDAETDIPLESFLSLFRRSFCSLKELTIIGTTYKNDPIINFFQNIPSLKELKLQPFRYSEFLQEHYSRTFLIQPPSPHTVVRPTKKEPLSSLDFNPFCTRWMKMTQTAFLGISLLICSDRFRSYETLVEGHLIAL
ncbi:hypothetical protein CPB84DRAFT_1846436 [Gymnopilus junonius]|uniref:F-box domain-containing protein n=1 Tax=Gymnopilus junonius TaxID=109634 RepID=A0A9P5NRM5_GYMJU|nr:hypothetical protein CPB84DRAFT_1846436 [Gymnopilus junonius]